MATPAQQQIIDDALMAGAAYVSTRGMINQIPVPTGWKPIYYQSFSLSGFEAAAFQNGNNIVISYAGTNPTSGPDWANNVLLGSGIGGVLSPQLYQAAEFYLQVAALIANNPNATISFTGHSLGGGLAALMAVFFNKQAITFDQAPFALSANSVVATVLDAYLQLQ
ncbi:MAG: lipase family protein, partial [Thiobacillaceae bacterium]